MYPLQVRFHKPHHLQEGSAWRKQAPMLLPKGGFKDVHC